MNEYIWFDETYGVGELNADFYYSDEEECFYEV